MEGEHIGSLRGFAFKVDPGTRLSDRKLLLAAAEKHLASLLQERADAAGVPFVTTQAGAMFGLYFSGADDSASNSNDAADAGGDGDAPTIFPSGQTPSP